MRRNVRERVAALAPFLTFDKDPYIVLGEDGRLSWILDAFTQSDSYPYSTHYTVDGQSVNYMRNSVKVVVDAYDGTTTFYVFDSERPNSGGLSRHLSQLVQGRVGDAGRAAQARALSGVTAQAAGGSLRPLSHDQSRGLL